MKKDKQTIIIIILIAILVLGFLIWFSSHRTTEKKYEACTDKCDAEYSWLGLNKFGNSQYKACRASCREKYGK